MVVVGTIGLVGILVSVGAAAGVAVAAGEGAAEQAAHMTRTAASAGRWKILFRICGIRIAFLRRTGGQPKVNGNYNPVPPAGSTAPGSG